MTDDHAAARPGAEVLPPGAGSEPGGDDAVDLAGCDSFPASDPPSWTGGTPRRPAQDQR